jgi:hypothetical protein
VYLLQAFVTAASGSIGGGIGISRLGSGVGEGANVLVPSPSGGYFQRERGEGAELFSGKEEILGGKERWRKQ